MYLIHGQNLVLSRKFLTEKIKEFSGEIIRLDGEKIDLTELKQTLESGSLFGKDKLIIVENLFSRRPSIIKDELIEYCRLSHPTNLIIWEGKEIDGRKLRSIPPQNVNHFALNKVIFKFLDSISPGNQKVTLNFYHQCLPQDPPELIFYLLSQRIRDLIIIKDLGEEGIARLAPWQKKKLAYQAKRFTLEQLSALYRELLRIDWEQKTGRAPLDLSSQLDLLLASL